MTVSELFKKYDFESVLPHLDHLFVVNSGHNLLHRKLKMPVVFITTGPKVRQNLRIAISGLFLVGNTQAPPLI